MMTKLLFLCGVQGSGKSTFARTQKVMMDAEVVATDVIRKKYKDIKEEDVFPTAYKLAADFLNNGKNVIFDATNITKDVRKRNLDAILSLLNCKVETSIVVFRIDPNECKRRVEIRNSLPGEFFIPLEVIDSYYKKFELISDDEGFDNIYYID